jgi:predicted nucleic acid-binding protein
MTELLGLLDSNVVIASVAQAHEHHEHSNALFGAFPRGSFAVALHSYSEAYSTLTRLNVAALFKWEAPAALAALDSVAAQCTLVGMTAAQGLEAMREFARAGGVGPRLFDKLIGETAVHNGIGTIITCNVGHFESLFPNLEVLDPKQFMKARVPD